MTNINFETKSDQKTFIISVILLVVIFIIAMGSAVYYKQEYSIAKDMYLTQVNNPLIIEKPVENQYQVAALQRQVEYYKKSYEHMKYSYDKLTAAVGNWKGVMEEWLEQTNAYYRRSH